MNVGCMTEKQDFSVYTLYSGSGGNCTYVRYCETEFLIDAGVSARAISEALKTVGSSMERICAVFVTHEHIDHIKGLEILCKKYKLPVHIATQSMDVLQDRYEHFPCCAILHEPRYCLHLSDEVSVSSFCTSHDSAMSVGYRVNAGNHTFATATDTGYITSEILEAMTGCESIILESNHDENMLIRGAYPYLLKKRIASNKGHLSNRACSDFLHHLAKNGTKRFLLAHLSKENNLPEIALHVSQRAVSDFSEEEKPWIGVAAANKPTRLI